MSAQRLGSRLTQQKEHPWWQESRLQKQSQPRGCHGVEAGLERSGDQVPKASKNPAWGKADPRPVISQGLRRRQATTRTLQRSETQTRQGEARPRPQLDSLQPGRLTTQKEGSPPRTTQQRPARPSTQPEKISSNVKGFAGSSHQMSAEQRPSQPGTARASQSSEESQPMQSKIGHTSQKEIDLIEQVTPVSSPAAQILRPKISPLAPYKHLLDVSNNSARHTSISPDTNAKGKATTSVQSKSMSSTQAAQCRSDPRSVDLTSNSGSSQDSAIELNEQSSLTLKWVQEDSIDISLGIGHVSAQLEAPPEEVQPKVDDCRLAPDELDLSQQSAQLDLAASKIDVWMEPRRPLWERGHTPPWRRRRRCSGELAARLPPWRRPRPVLKQPPSSSLVVAPATLKHPLPARPPSPLDLPRIPVAGTQRMAMQTMTNSNLGQSFRLTRQTETCYAPQQQTFASRSQCQFQYGTTFSSSPVMPNRHPPLYPSARPSGEGNSSQSASQLGSSPFLHSPPQLLAAASIPILQSELQDYGFASQQHPGASVGHIAHRNSPALAPSTLPLRSVSFLQRPDWGYYNW